MTDERVQRIREMQDASENAIDSTDDLQTLLESITIDNEQVQRIKEDLRENLHNLKVLQMMIEIPRQNVANMLRAEISNHYLQELDITRYAKEYLEKTQEIEVLLTSEMNKLKQAVCDLMTAYNQYEEALKVSELDTSVKLERKKKIGVIPKKALQESKDEKIAEILIDYEETADVPDAMEQKIRRSLLKKEFKALFKDKEEAEAVFKQTTGESL